MFLIGLFSIFSGDLFNMTISPVAGCFLLAFGGKIEAK